jgi:predicted MFS family arabinose efflux permease
VQDGVHPVQAVAFLAQLAARASPLQALLTEVVPEEQRGSVMSLAMAAGQLGFGAGGAIASPAYGMYRHVSNTVIGAASVVLTALLVWRLLPEPQLKTV